MGRRQGVSAAPRSLRLPRPQLPIPLDQFPSFSLRRGQGVSSARHSSITLFRERGSNWSSDHVESAVVNTPLSIGSISGQVSAQQAANGVTRTVPSQSVRADRGCRSMVALPLETMAEDAGQFFHGTRLAGQATERLDGGTVLLKQPGVGGHHDDR